MKVLITGGGGFLGAKLAHALVERGHLRGKPITELILADLKTPAGIEAAFTVRGISVDITERAAVDEMLTNQPDVIYHLAAIVSGQAEAEFETGMQVNLFGTLNILQAVRSLATCPVMVYASSIAVYGGNVPEPIEDWTELNPQTSYGTQKAAGELLLNDFSRKGFLDGRGLRLPTISIRPGKPNRAASSFMSSMFREPLQGKVAICPVPPDFTHWFLSPRRCIENLIHGAEIDGADLGSNRCLVLPGRTHTIGEMVEAMRRIAGDGAVGLIRWEPDPEIQKIVMGWKGRFNPARALQLGFVSDSSFEDNVRFFLEDDVRPGR